MASYIKTLTDGVNQILPRTRTSAVLDDDNVALTVLLDGKQAALVSGTNIKTINSNSILGSGNIEIQGGGTPSVIPSSDIEDIWGE